MLKRAFGVVGRVYKDAFDLATVKGQQGFEGFEVVALDEEIVLDGWWSQGAGRALTPALSRVGRGS
jgi:hypothetical protein